MDKRHIDWSLYLITDRHIAHDRDILKIVQAAISGGVTVVQLREKTASTAECIRTAKALHAITRRAGIPLIINDRVDVALAIDAEGVHLGPPDDMPASIARRLLGSERIMGVSAGSPQAARQAAEDGADYVGVGDLFGTKSKKDAGKPIGLAGLKAVVDASPVPVVGIGGIDAGNAERVMEAGAHGVAVISAIMAATDPAAAARRLRACIDRKRTAS